MTHSLRAPCKCGGTSGKIETKGGQDCVYCLACGKFQYNAPRVETGRAQRTVTTVHNGIKPNQRSRVLNRASGRCEICGYKPDGTERTLHVGHLLSVKDGMAQGMTEAELNNDENLAAMCDECNLGLGDETVPARLVVGIIRARVAMVGKIY